MFLNQNEIQIKLKFFFVLQIADTIEWRKKNEKLGKHIN
jgi:hypothetical protein